MAGQNYQVNYNIAVNSAVAVQEIGRFVSATAELQKAQQNFNKINQSINNLNNRLASFAKKAPVIQINTKEAERKIDRLIGKLSQLEAKAGSLGVSIGAVGGWGGASGGNISGGTGNNAPGNRAPKGRGPAAPIRTVRGGNRNFRYQALGQTLVDTGGVGVMDFLKGMGIAYGIAGLGGAIGGVIRDASEYNNLMQTTKNILGSHDKDLNFSGRFSNMEKIVRNVGVETKFTAPEVADAAKFLAMAGFNLEDINQSIRPIADIALIGDDDLGKTADVVTNIMTSYGIAPENVRRAADIMTMTFTKSNTTLMEIAESYKYAGSLLSRYGTPFEEATAAIGVLGDAGIKASQAGTTLRTMALNIAKPTKAQREMWESLGISRTDKNGEMRPLLELFQELGAKNLTLAQFGQLFHKTAASGASALASHVDKWNEIVEKNFMSDGMAAKLADAKKNTIQGLWYQITSSFTEAGMQAFEDLEGPIRDMMGKVLVWMKDEDTINKIKRLSQTVFEFVGVLLNMTKALIRLYERFEGFIKGWLKLQLTLSMVLVPLRAISALFNFGSFAAKGVAIIGGLANRFLGLAGAITRTSGAISGLNATAGVGARTVSPEVWARWASINGHSRAYTSATRFMYNNRASIVGAGALVGGLGGAYLGSLIGPEGSGWNMLGSIVGMTLGSAGGMKAITALPKLLGAIGAAGSLAVGGVLAIGGAIAALAINSKRAEEASRSWGETLRSLGVDELNFSSTEAILTGNMRIYTKAIVDQNNALSLGVDLYKRYWKAKNGEEDSDANKEKPFTETVAGTFFKDMLGGKGRYASSIKEALYQLGEAGYGNFEQNVYGSLLWNGKLVEEGKVLDAFTRSGSGWRVNKAGASQTRLMQLAANNDNPDRKALESYILGSFVGAQNSAHLANLYDAASKTYLSQPAQFTSENWNDLGNMSYGQLRTTKSYWNIWSSIGSNMLAPWDWYREAMKALEGGDKGSAATATYNWLSNYVPAFSTFFSGANPSDWASRINEIYNNPSILNNESIKTKEDVEVVVTGIMETIRGLYSKMGDKYKVLLEPYFNSDNWKNIALPGWKTPTKTGWSVLVPGAEDVNNPTSGATNSNGGSNPYKNQYSSTNAVPKQVIINIDSLMNVDKIDMSDPNNAATIDTINQQIAAKLWEVVADSSNDFNKS